MYITWYAVYYNGDEAESGYVKDSSGSILIYPTEEMLVEEIGHWLELEGYDIKEIEQPIHES